MLATAARLRDHMRLKDEAKSSAALGGTNTVGRRKRGQHRPVYAPESSLILAVNMLFAFSFTN